MINKIFSIFYIISLMILTMNCKNKITNLNDVDLGNRINNTLEINYETFSLIIDSIKLDFPHFPTNYIWDNTIFDPILDTEIKMNYKTIITNASKEMPNFDGKYRIVEFGYGSGAQYFFIIDLNNGNVYEGKPSIFGIKYELESSLIIINEPEEILEYWSGWEETIPNWTNMEYLLWQDNQFKNLLIVNP